MLACGSACLRLGHATAPQAVGKARQQLLAAPAAPPQAVLQELHAELAAADVARAMTADTKDLHGAVSKLGKVGAWLCWAVLGRVGLGGGWREGAAPHSRPPAEKASGSQALASTTHARSLPFRLRPTLIFALQWNPCVAAHLPACLPAGCCCPHLCLLPACLPSRLPARPPLPTDRGPSLHRRHLQGL